MRPSGGGRTRLVFHAPTRGLIGYQSELLSDTRGTAVFNRLFHEYAPYKGDIAGRRNGVLISNGQGEFDRLCALVPRGPRRAAHRSRASRVYEGMIVGEHTRGNDLEVNVLKGKQLTNVRAAGKEEKRLLTPPIRLSLEAGARLYRGGRAGRGDAEIDPPAQDRSSTRMPASARTGPARRRA